MNTVTTTDRLTLSIPETAAALGVSRPGLEAWVQEQEGNYAAKK